jgi:hypothetical protein
MLLKTKMEEEEVEGEREEEGTCLSKAKDDSEFLVYLLCLKFFEHTIKYYSLSYVIQSIGQIGHILSISKRVGASKMQNNY